MRIFKLIILSLLLCDVQSQQLPHYSQYWNILNYDNPAACGKSGTFNSTLISRKQWTGFEGSPFTTSSVSDIFLKEKNIGLGLVTGYDIIGFHRNFETRLQGSYRFTAGPVKINFGIETGFTNFRLKNPLWISIDPAQQDPAIPDGSTNDFGFQLGTGLMVFNDNFFAGLSVRQLLATKYKNAHITPVPHYYLQGGYKFNVGATLHLMPVFQVESDATSTQITANLNYFIKEKIIFGIGYRLRDAVILNIGYQMPQWKFGYSYDITTSAIQYYSKGSHELFVKFLLNKDKGTIIQ